MAYNSNLYPVNDPIAALDPSNNVVPLNIDGSGNLKVTSGGGAVTAVSGAFVANSITDLASLLNLLLDEYGTAQTITAATTFSGVPTVSQLTANTFAIIASNGDNATFVAALKVASAFVGTITFYGVEPDGTTLQAISSHLRGGSSTIATSSVISTASALNQAWAGSSAGFKTVYAVCTAFTSGSIVAQVGISAAPYAVAITNTVNTNVTQVNGTSLSNTNPLPSQDIEQSGYTAGSSPPTATNAGSDTSYTFASQVSRIIMQNNTSANVYYAFDVAATLGSLVLLPGGFLSYPKKCTVLHLYTVAAQNINGSAVGAIVVLGAN